MSLDLLRTGPTEGPRLVLAHGAGAAMDSDWMNRICDLLAAREIGTVRFEFGYMAARRTGGRKPPPKAETLVGEYRAVLSALETGSPPVIGGKSMGGRVASLVAEEAIPRISSLRFAPSRDPRVTTRKSIRAEIQGRSRRNLSS